MKLFQCFQAVKILSSHIGILFLYFMLYFYINKFIQDHNVPGYEILYYLELKQQNIYMQNI